MDFEEFKYIMFKISEIIYQIDSVVINEIKKEKSINHDKIDFHSIRWYICKQPNIENAELGIYITWGSEDEMEETFFIPLTYFLGNIDIDFKHLIKLLKELR